MVEIISIFEDDEFIKTNDNDEVIIVYGETDKSYSEYSMPKFSVSWTNFEQLTSFVIVYCQHFHERAITVR